MQSNDPVLPHESHRRFLIDGSLESWLVYDEGLAMPHGASFPLLNSAVGRSTLLRYYERLIETATANEMGFMLVSPTWRASADWAGQLGYSKSALTVTNEAAIQMLRGLRARHESPNVPILVSGCVGPRDDEYAASTAMRADTAEVYHNDQIATFRRAGCDLVGAMAMTNTPEAIGIVRAASAHGAACVVSFTVDGEGRLASGEPLKAAIAKVDAATGAAPAFYMVDCAQPASFADSLETGGAWKVRVRGLRAIAWRKDDHAIDGPARFDSSTWATGYKRLFERLPDLRVLGGCCDDARPPRHDVTGRRSRIAATRAHGVTRRTSTRTAGKSGTAKDPKVSRIATDADAAPML